MTEQVQLTLFPWCPAESAVFEDVLYQRQALLYLTCLSDDQAKSSAVFRPQDPTGLVRLVSQSLSAAMVVQLCQRSTLYIHTWACTAAQL